MLEQSNTYSILLCPQCSFSEHLISILSWKQRVCWNEFVALSYTPGRASVLFFLPLALFLNHNSHQMQDDMLSALLQDQMNKGRQFPLCPMWIYRLESEEKFSRKNLKFIKYFVFLFDDEHPWYTIHSQNCATYFSERDTMSSQFYHPRKKSKCTC